MRVMLLLSAAPLLAAAAPALAQPAPQEDVSSEIQRVLDDPRTDQTMSQSLDAMTDALLNLPVGELKAIVDGRRVTDADKRLTVRDLARRDDPQFEAKLRGQLATTLPKVRQSMKSLAASLPALVKSFEEAGAAIERATANLPSPTYPRR